MRATRTRVTTDSSLGALLSASPLRLWVHAPGQTALGGPAGAGLIALFAAVVTWYVAAALTGLTPSVMASGGGESRALALVGYALIAGALTYLVVAALGARRFARTLADKRDVASVMLGAGYSESEIALLVGDSLALDQGRTDGQPRGI